MIPLALEKFWSKSGLAVFHVHLLFLVVSLALVGCATSARYTNTQDAELDVIVSFLDQEYDGRSNTSFVIEDIFSVATVYGETPKQRERSLVSAASKTVPADLIKDFCAKNAKTQAVWSEITSRLAVKLISQEELNSTFAPKVEGKPDGWDIFYAKYPNCPGIITLSRVGFSRDGNVAMLYVGLQSHWINGSGRIHVLRKQDRKWVEILPPPIGTRWIS
jgi:hypothetical protein